MIAQIDKLLKIDASPPENLKPWLVHSSSLTEKLKNLSGDAELQVLKQSWNLLNWWDKYTLGLTTEPIFHRDIIMLSQQIPCWFARTIIPNKCYQANHSFFDRLAHESLGVILFNEPKIKRTVLHNYAINERCLEFHWLPESLKMTNQHLWLRLSVFRFPDRTCFYLVEILFPSLMRVIK